MNKYWIFIAFLAGFGVLSYAEFSHEAWPEDGNWYSDELADLGILDDDSQDYSEENVKNPIVEERKENKDDNPEAVETSDFDNDKQVAEEIEKFENEQLENPSSNDDNDKDIDNIDDYQIEDNRSDVKEDEKKPSDDTYMDEDLNLKESANIKDEESFEDDEEDAKAEAEEDEKEKLENEDDIEEEPLAQDSFEEDFAENIDKDNPEEDVEEKKILEETKALLNSDNDDDFADDKFIELDEKQNIDIEKEIEELKKLMQGAEEDLEEDDNLDDSVENFEINLEKDSNDSKNDKDDEEDTFDKAYDDLIKDLNKLDETRNKLNEEIKASNPEAPGFEESKSDEADADEEDDDDYELIEDKNLHEIFIDHQSDENQFEDDVEDAEEDEALQRSNKDSVLDEVIKSDSTKQIPYVNDAVLANEGTDEEEPKTTTAEAVEAATERTAHTPKVHKVEPLEEVEVDSGEFNKLIGNFINNHGEELHAQSANIASDVEPIRVTLSVDEPVVITSPNYPRPYPTNAVIDWILEGEGMGIEFNVTDFAVNGNIGDYVLVKPGGVDASGNDGLVFSYVLRSERRYRFTNVNRMFIRFDAKLGMQWQRGFSFSIRMIAPLPDERQAEPETLPIPYPQSTLTVNLGGLTLEDFLKVKEDFRLIIADMATMFINANGIDPGLNTTSEVTQIMSTALCYHNWPNFEQCAEVRFGVPLQYEDENQERLSEDELADMWTTFSQQDPFAVRLRRLGISEFQIPNDSNVLMVWLVIAAGVVISMAMLAFALWRYSCFEDYTRMPTFGDSESLQEKKTLDLYPTPHQTLPPLYSETDYKWGDAKFDDSTRVDIGGFSNRSYVRSEPYDFDSDEEVVPARDRYTTDV